MMRTKILFGLLAVAITSIATGTYLCNRSDAQDTPTGNKLFDQLKKDLEAKKDSVLPALPTISQGVPEPTIPPPMVVEPKAVPTPPARDVATPSAQPVPPIDVAKPKPPEPLPTPPSPRVEPKPVDLTPPPLPARTADGPATASAPRVPSAELKNVDGPMVEPMPPSPAFQAPQPPQPPMVTPSAPPVRVTTPSPGIVTPPMPKNSPWSFQVEVADGQATVTATVNKKHAFKIVCKHVDLQTEQSTLRARGNVTITGEMMEGSCSNLSIPLLDDRVVLEGSAEVRIHKNVVSAYTSNPTVAQFELKGETLNLRLSELQSNKLWQASMRQDEVIPAPMMAVSQTSPAPTIPSVTSKSWSPNGKLRRTEERHNNQPVWSLEDSTGRTICRFVTREGGSLNQYVGQTISVHLERLDASMQRVTHIAIP